MNSCASAEAIKRAATSSIEDITKPAYATPSPSEDPATITCIQDLNVDILGIILNSIYTDAQVSNAQIPCRPGALQSRKLQYGAWCVCKQWRESLRACPINLARTMVAVHGADGALLRAAGCKIRDFDELELVRLILTLGAKADCQHGEVLVEAARNGHEAVVRLLLEWREHAPRANCLGGTALEEAAKYGHEAVLRLLLGWREHAPRADSDNGLALVMAARNGQEAVVQLLLGWRDHAPRADCRHGLALVEAALIGHESLVRLLLGWRDHAPRADCRYGDALVMAAERGHVAVVRLLLDCDSTPRADCQGGRAMQLAERGGHITVLQMLQECCGMLAPA